MFSGSSVNAVTKTLSDLDEIGDLNINEELTIEIEEIVSILE